MFNAKPAQTIFFFILLPVVTITKTNQKKSEIIAKNRRIDLFLDIYIMFTLQQCIKNSVCHGNLTIGNSLTFAANKFGAIRSSSNSFNIIHFTRVMPIYRIMFIVVLIQDVIIQLRIHKNYLHSALIGLMSLTQVCMRATKLNKVLSIFQKQLIMTYFRRTTEKLSSRCTFENHFFFLIGF